MMGVVGAADVAFVGKEPYNRLLVRFASGKKNKQTNKQTNISEFTFTVTL